MRLILTVLPLGGEGRKRKNKGTGQGRPDLADDFRGALLSNLPRGRWLMPKVRVLVGTRKGAFVLTSDEGRRRWQVEGPHFGGWEVYHLKGSPVNPDRIWASQSTG